MSFFALITGGVLGDIAKAVTKTALAGFFSKILGKTLTPASPVGASFTSTWVFGFDLVINFAGKDVNFAFVFAKKKENVVSATEATVKVEAGLHIEVGMVSRTRLHTSHLVSLYIFPSLQKNTVCTVSLGKFMQDIFSKKDPKEL